MKNANIFVDVDLTLVDANGKLLVGAPEALQRLRDKGCHLFLWSTVGPEYCRKVAQLYGLTELFEGFTAKPDIIIDDMPANIVEWSAIERCRYDYEIKRVHLENDDIKKQFGEFNPQFEQERAERITDFLDTAFKPLFQNKSVRDPRTDAQRYRLGFDVAASGQGDLSAIYIDELIGGDLWLAGLFTARTEDWHFLNTVLFHFLWKLKNVRAAGDESGLGRQICWEAASKWSYKFKKVNFTTRKHDLGFALMNQLAVAEKRFPRSHQDIASDFFALRKMHTGTRWNFSEGKNLLNPASHCDIAWAAALSTFAHMENKTGSCGASVIMEDGTVLHSHQIPVGSASGPTEEQWERYMLNSNDPAIWKPFGR